MAYRYTALIFFIGILLSGCNQNCPITCGESAGGIAAVNYTNAELDSVIFNAYTANDSFNDLISSTVIPDSDSVLSYTGLSYTGIKANWLDYDYSASGVATTSGSPIGDTLSPYNFPYMYISSDTILK